VDLTELQAFRTWLTAQLGAGYIVKGGPMPDTPDRCISVQDYPGPPAPNWQGDYRVQIRCRAALQPAGGVSSYNDCHAMADSVVAVVAPPGDVPAIATLTGGRRAIVKLMSGPLNLGPDGKGRSEMTINVALAVARV
jgi:hypothetical protein